MKHRPVPGIKLVSPVFTSLLCLGWLGPANAITLSESFDLNITLTALSDYRDTGISQTRGNPALQGEVILEHASGLYAGAAMSSVDYGTPSRREDMYFAGVTIPFSEEIYLDTYLGRYEYNKDAYADYNEFYAELGAYGFQLGYTYGFDYRGHQPNNSNVFLAYNFNLPYESKLNVRYGYSDANTEAFWSANGDARRTYHDWEIKLSKELLGVNVFASYIDTDLSKAECASAFKFEDVCSATVVVGVSKRF